MINIFKSRIEKAAEKHEKLLIKRQEIQNSVMTANSKLETKIKKLEFKAYINRERAIKKTAIINRTLRKLEKDIENEKEFANSLEVTKADEQIIKEV